MRIAARLGAVSALASLLLASPILAAPTPESGELTPAAPQLEFSGGFMVSDPTASACGAPSSPTCDEFALKISLPSDYAVTFPDAKIRVSMIFDDLDYDLFVDTAAGEAVGSSDLENPEVVEFDAINGTNDYVVTVNSFISGGGLEGSGTYTTTVTLIPGTSVMDIDGDGVSNADDDCPGTPAGTAVDADGCPLADSDGDGVTDGNDDCPGTAPGATVDANGCEIADEDGDGVTDADDDCPGTPAGTDVDAAGCAVPVLGSGDSCEVPGVTILTDPAADNSPPAPGTDLRALGMVQPAQAGTGDRIEDQLIGFRFTISPGGVASPSTIWFASFQTPAGVLQGVRMTGDGSGGALFESYFVGADNSGGTDGRFGDGAKAADASSSFDSTGGAITIFVKATDLGFTKPGQQLKAFNVGVMQTVGGVLATGATDGMPNNDLSRSTVTYTLHDNTVCGGRPLKGIAPPAPASGLPPRYQIHVAPAAMGNDAGEPSVGVNRHSDRSMFISYTTALRQTYQENMVPQLLPASCDALWEEKPGLLTTLNSLDPILFTDELTGRTFNSQLSGDNSLMEYTDDDGDTWVPAQAGPPNGGADHQAVATGPYPADAVPLTASWPAGADKRAVYYCSQSVATAFCSRSDDGGRTFGPGFTFKNTDCSAGALHGHVKVAPNGTVYVPDSSQCVLPLGESAEHVGVFASTDAGQTWEFRDVPQSTGGDGSDPSVGIATDGTLYMCYPNADSTVHVAVSDDEGVTWSGGQDIGAAAGLVQTRFPHMIAGDGDRAACAFLGTTTPGNGSSLDFDGVWHGYVATTYDKGLTWHLVNVTPDDPVQGHGGIGPDGINRNLLDFNDLQIDEFGRTYFAFADGCTDGCVKDPSKNAFAAKATIVRQTGGRTLFAQYDDVSTSGLAVARYNATTPIKPAEACARQDISQRSPVKADIRWNAPDTGGSLITNYKVYRDTSPTGPFTTFIGDAGPLLSLTDTTVKPSVEKYYYRVDAQNALGTAAPSNVIELAITVDATDPCKVPGEIISQDATGDVNPAGPDDLDIEYLGVAETVEAPDDFTITMKMATFTAGVPPTSSFYVILFPDLDNLYIALDSANGPTHFAYGTATPDPAGQGFFVFEEVGELPDSSFAEDGTITFVVPRTLLGSPAVGSVIAGFDARSRIGAASANSRDTAGNVSYTVRGIAACADPGFVIADLVASTNEGKDPLPVTFLVTGGQSKNKALATYELLFGDEPGASPTPTTGSFAGASKVSVSHTYAEPGVYRARLKVTDEAGGVSTNLAEQTITVLDNLAPIARAGIDRAVDEGTAVELDGSQSEEPDGDDLTYLWTQRSGPTVMLSGADTDTLAFTAPTVDAATPMVFRLTVRDPEGLEHFDEVAVLVRDIGGGPVDPSGPGAPGATDLGNNSVGGAMPMLSLAALALLALARRRRRQA